MVVLVTVVVDAHLLQQGRVRHAIPDEVEAPMPRPQVIVEACDRIAKYFLLRWQEEGEIRKDLVKRALRETRFIRRTAPDVIAGIDRLHLGHYRSTDTGADTVAAYENITVLDAPA